MLFIIYGQFEEDEKEKLDEAHGLEIAKELVTAYKEYLDEDWKVWYEEENVSG